MLNIFKLVDSDFTHIFKAFCTGKFNLLHAPIRLLIYDTQAHWYRLTHIYTNLCTKRTHLEMATNMVHSLYSKQCLAKKSLTVTLYGSFF